MSLEAWKDIKGYESLYQVSSFGRVRSLDRVTPNGRVYYGKILKRTLDRYGYFKVTLSINGCHFTKYVHRLVASAFLPNPNDYPQVNHIDENKENNNYKNLEWCTESYNSNYGNRITNMVKNTDYAKRSENTNYVEISKHNNYQSSNRIAQRKLLHENNKIPIIAIRGDISLEFDSITSAAKHVNGDPSAISKVLRGKYKTHKGWVFKNKLIEGDIINE